MRLTDGRRESLRPAGRHYLRRQDADLDVGGLRQPREQGERLWALERVTLHHDPDGLPDQGTGVERKSQGLELSGARESDRDMGGQGQAFVAVSRVEPVERFE